MLWRPCRYRRLLWRPWWYSRLLWRRWLHWWRRLRRMCRNRRNGVVWRMRWQRWWPIWWHCHRRGWSHSFFFVTLSDEARVIAAHAKHLFVVGTYISARVVHSGHPRVPVLKVWNFDVRKTRPKTRAPAQRASARQTRARHHRPRTLSFRSRWPVGTDVVDGLRTAVTRHRIIVELVDIAALVRRICFEYDRVVGVSFAVHFIPQGQGRRDKVQ